MLTYIYTGTLDPDMGDQAELLSAADKYGLLELKELCKEVLCRRGGLEDGLDLLVLADRQSAAKIKQF